MRKFVAVAAIIFLIGIFAGYAGVHADVSARIASCANVGSAPALCQDLGQSVIAWQHALASPVPQLVSFLFIALLCILFFRTIPLRSHHRTRYLRSRSLLPRSFLQELFADGILHPKLFWACLRARASYRHYTLTAHSMNASVLAKVATPIAVLAAGGLIAGALYWQSEAAGNAGKPSGANPPIAVNIAQVNTTNEPTIGSPNAPIAMAYWSDYQCPYCSRFDTTELPQIIQNYVDTGKIRIVFKDFQFIGPDSDMDALYARAVWHLYPNMFGAWHQAMYASQPQENTLDATANLAHIRTVTQSIPGMDFNMLTDDMNANKAEYETRITADRSEGAALGINATPSFVIGMQLISGAEAYADMAKAIDIALISK